ncbi:uncharacterized protein LY89DRAFT_138446 [Mollisia scopiformis]|uniref:Uncharacterized protein n=1 Tax=Mollisia scopiformis TaxID=149040 RepID=A0A194X318_MOLSC|nr:uncharacterized protein LY89DRAFT_138446 [Mollisia scopiformis]KUJ14419.1 hypothetical protein LY89DRAFT_138446 [Mollisia scopiformis]
MASQNSIWWAILQLKVAFIVEFLGLWSQIPQSPLCVNVGFIFRIEDQIHLKECSKNNQRLSNVVQRLSEKSFGPVAVRHCYSGKQEDALQSAKQLHSQVRCDQRLSKFGSMPGCVVYCKDRTILINFPKQPSGSNECFELLEQWPWRFHGWRKCSLSQSCTVFVSFFNHNSTAFIVLTYLQSLYFTPRVPGVPGICYFLRSTP